MSITAEHDTVSDPDPNLVAEINELAANDEAGSEEIAPSAAAATGDETRSPVRLLEVPVELLASHPDNVREELVLGADFLSSMKNKVEIPLLITDSDGPGPYRIVDGERRLLAAIELGLKTLPCVYDPEASRDAAGQFLTMWTTDVHKKKLTTAEQAHALVQARIAGASMARIVKTVGGRRKAKAWMAAGELPEETRARAKEAGYAWSLEEYAQLAEFADDAEATERLLAAAERGNFAHRLAREKNDRAENTRKSQIAAELAEAGIPLVEDLSPGAMPLYRLVDENGEGLTEQTHAACPGHAARFNQYGAEPSLSYYCLDPAARGHRDSWTREPIIPKSEPTAAGAAEAKAESSAKKRRVIEGNKDMRAANDVRRAWLQELCSRASLPREEADLIAQFTTECLILQPEPMRKLAGDYASLTKIEEMLGLSGGREAITHKVAAANRGKLIILGFGAIAAAYERRINEKAWRKDLSDFEMGGSGDTRRWLRICEELGYSFSPIEQAIADDVEYAPESQSSHLDPDTADDSESDGADQADAYSETTQSGDEDDEPQAPSSHS
jgi:ParB family chromosome partitioning protein